MKYSGLSLAEIQYKQITEHLFRATIELESCLDWINGGEGYKEISKIHEKLQQIYFEAVKETTE